MAEDTIQEQLVAARQAQILQAATKVFAEKGFHRATIPDIAKEAGIAVGTIYNYFGKKEDLLLALLHRMNQTEQREDNLAMSADMDMHEFVQHYVGQRYSYMTKEGLDVLRAVLPQVLVDPELQAHYMEQVVMPTFALAEKHFTKMIEDGKMRAVDVPLMLRMMSSTFLGLLILRIMGDPVVENQWNELPALFTTITLDGLTPRE